MSDQTTAPPGPPRAHPRARRRGVLALVAAVLAVVLIAGGGFAAWQFFLGGGPRPAEVLPASTFALATVDLDPAGGQKVAAIKTLRKFPSWRKRTGPMAESDLMKSVVDQVLEGGPCKALDYEKDVEPWIGSRAGVGGVLLEGDKPVPVLTLQIKGRDKARSGFARLAKCSGAEGDLGWTLTDDYIIASDSTAHAQAIAAAGEDSQLAADADFAKWTEEAGGTGVMNFYLAPKAPAVAFDLLGSQLEGLTGGLTLGGDSGGLGAFPTELPSGLPTDLPSELATAFPSGFPTRVPTKIPTVAPAASGTGADEKNRDEKNRDEKNRDEKNRDEKNSYEKNSYEKNREIDKARETFKGAAAVLRFADGGIELSVASGAEESEEDVPTVSDQVEALPEDTAAVVALAVPKEAFAGRSGEAENETRLDLLDLLGGLTGLDLPEDLQTLLGESFSLSLGGAAPADLESIEGLDELPLGALIHGETAEIEPVVDKVVKGGAGTFGDLLTTTSAEDKVAVATTPTYAEMLLADGALDDDDGFGKTVRHVDDAQALVYVDLDGEWAQRIAGMLSQQDDEGNQELAGNLAVLRGFGATAWTEGETARALIRLSAE